MFSHFFFGAILISGSAFAPLKLHHRHDRQLLYMKTLALAQDMHAHGRHIIRMGDGQSSVLDVVADGIVNRRALLSAWDEEGTQCYRLFHGATEGCPGLTVDRYGTQLVIQTFRERLDESEALKIASVAREAIAGGENLSIWLRHRGDKELETKCLESLTRDALSTALELGLRYEVGLQSLDRRDPLLFLDFRVVRRWLLAHSKDKEVLNLFSYTCGAGVAALAGQARHVTNVDFSQTALDVGAQNARLNQLPMDRATFVCADVLPTIRQFGGLPVGGRRTKKQKPPKYAKVGCRKFDVIVLDPPTWAKSSFGAVDIRRDYQTLFKPAVLATKTGGVVVATNHLSVVDKDTWVDQLTRCAAKAGRPIQKLEMMEPERDFPSPDGKHPLKIACCWV